MRPGQEDRTNLTIHHQDASSWSETTHHYPAPTTGMAVVKQHPPPLTHIECICDCSLSPTLWEVGVNRQQARRKSADCNDVTARFRKILVSCSSVSVMKRGATASARLWKLTPRKDIQTPICLVTWDRRGLPRVPICNKCHPSVRSDAGLGDWGGSLQRFGGQGWGWGSWSLECQTSALKADYWEI